jgi:hypothetical protein
MTVGRIAGPVVLSAIVVIVAKFQTQALPVQPYLWPNSRRAVNLDLARNQNLRPACRAIDLRHIRFAEM